MKKTILLVITILVLTSCAQERTKEPQIEKTIQLGWLGPLTGDAASTGRDALIASEMAVEEINTTGGLNGRKIELIVEDGGCDAKTASQAGSKLINIDKVPVIIGGKCSGETMSIAPMAEENHVVLFSGCSTAQSITYAGDYVFRSAPSDAFQGKFSAEYAYKKLGKRKTAILAVLGDFGSGIKESFAQKFEQLGGQIVLVQDYAQDSRDLRAELTKIKSTDADLIYFIGYTASTISGLKQAQELGISLPFLGGDSWDDAKIHENDFAEGIMYAVTTSNVSEAWKDKLEEKGAHATVCAPGAYNNVKIIADIIKKVGTDPSAIKDELYKIKDYQGVNGMITIDENGDLERAQYSVKIVKNGKSEVME